MPRSLAVLSGAMALALAAGAPISLSRAAAASRLDAPEVRRGFALVGPRASDAPALRLERQTREPSASFILGAGLGAWINAAATLAYDLKTPSGDGGDEETIGEDCYDERQAFAHLEAGRVSLGAEMAQAVAAAGVSDPGVVAAWSARRLTSAPSGCR